MNKRTKESLVQKWLVGAAGILLVFGLLAGFGCGSGPNSTCTAGNCDQTCNAADGACNRTCAGGGCKQICAPGISCNFTCAGGNCTQTCDKDSTSCNFTCGKGGCTQTGAGVCTPVPLTGTCA